MAKGRSDDPMYFLKIPIKPDGIHLVPNVDPLKLHLGVLTNIFEVDHKDTKKTGSRVFKQVLGIEHVIRKYVDTTEIVSILRVEMQKLALELVGDHGDVGEHIIELLGVFEQELPQLFDMIGQGAMDEAEKVANALTGKVRNVALRITSQLSVADIVVSNAEAVDETREQFLKNWSQAVLMIVRALGEIKELYQLLDGVLADVSLACGTWEHMENAEDEQFSRALACIGRDGEFRKFASAYVADSSSYSSEDASCLLERAENVVHELQVSERKVHDEWHVLKEETLSKISGVNQTITRLRSELDHGLGDFCEYAEKLVSTTLKPYQLKGDDICTQEQFEEAEKTPWTGVTCFQTVGAKTQEILRLLKTDPPQLPEKVKQALEFAKVQIEKVKDKLPEVGGSIGHSHASSSNGGNDFDDELIDYIYEIICCVGYVLTCNHKSNTCRGIHSMLHVASKLSVCGGLITEKDIPSLRTSISKRARAQGECHKFVMQKKEDLIAAWETAQGVRWVTFEKKKDENKRGWWPLKFAKRAAPDTIRLMEKHGIETDEVLQAKKICREEARCDCYSKDPRSKGSEDSLEFED
ncbi:hypothetical protein HYW94_03755 [Candidatus Uhrbacteria bacterium]|nr:hypothetical protein [Candidatus Uhrbacteria bacterium]